MPSQKPYPGSIMVKLRRLPYLVAMGMEGAGRSGLAGSASERNAMVSSLVEGRRSYPKNDVIRSIVPEGADENELLLTVVRQHDEILDCLRYQDIEDNKGLQKHVLKVLSLVLGILQANESAETIREFKDWLLMIAKNVAHAGKEGDFLGIGGERFSKEEQRFYHQLSSHLDA